MARPGIGGSVEGLHAVVAALAAGRVEILHIEGSRRDALSELVADARTSGTEIRFVDDVGTLASTSAPQGVVARCRPRPTVTVEALVAAADPPALLVLDHIEDPRNAGAIARSIVAAGMSGMVLSSHRGAPLEATAFKAAAGALEHLSVAVVSSIADAVDRLKRSGVWTVGLDSDGDSNLFDLGLLAEPVAVVVGAEGGGLSRLVRERVDTVASIPMSPQVESLNASVAASLAAFEVARVRGGTVGGPPG